MTDKQGGGLTRTPPPVKLGLDGKPLAQQPPKEKPKPQDHHAKHGVPTPSSLQTATALANKTNVPQPVVENGKVVYYVDADGAVVPDAIAAERRKSAGLDTPASRSAVESGAAPASASTAVDPSAPPPPQSDAQIAQGISDYDALQNQFRRGGNARLNGVDMGSTTDPLGINGAAGQAGKGPYGSAAKQNPDGTWTVLAGDGTTNVTDTYFGQEQIANSQANSTFAALALPQAYNANTNVMFSQGAGGLTPQGTQVTRLANGQMTYESKQDNRQDLIAGPRGMAANQPMNSAQQQSQAQHMTLGAGLQWFVNLSVTDPGAYSQLVANLNKAGYFSSQSGNMNYLPENQLPLNGYSRNAGEALVEAMQDLSVAQSAGETTDMAGWLAKRSKGYEDYINSGAGYNAVNRSYQDPATLAATAKSAAAQAIGRNLTPAEEAKFEAAFRGKENSAYNEIDQYGRAKAVANFTAKSGLPAGTPTGYTMPDSSGEADQYLNNNPQFGAEKQGYAGLELTKGLIGFLKGGGF